MVLLGLSLLAVSEPLLGIFGVNPELFFAAGASSVWDTALFAGLLIVMPPLILGLAMAVFGVALSDDKYRVFCALIYAAIVSSWFVQQLKYVLQLTTPVVILGLALVALVAAFVVFRKFSKVEYGVRFLALAAPLVFAFFVFFSETGLAVRQLESESVNSARSSQDQPSLVFILLDEFPTEILMDDEAEIESSRFPQLYQFSKQATWYRRYSVLASQTRYSVPAILTGKFPKSSPATFVHHPDNLFTLLADSHNFLVSENGTKLCASTSCSLLDGPEEKDASGFDMSAMLQEAMQLYTRRTAIFSQSALELDEFQEELSEAGDPVAGKPAPVDDDAMRADPMRDGMAALATHGNVELITLMKVMSPARWDEFLQSAAKVEEPALLYMHLSLPHQPWHFYANGTAYSIPKIRNPISVDNSDGGEWIARLSEYRLLQQAMYTDGLLEGLFDVLKAQGLWDSAYIVVTSDHGISFDQNVHRRSLVPESFHSVAYAPLFIRAPGQSEGRVDDTNVMSHDLLPTLAELLGMPVPWKTDGESVASVVAGERGSDKLYFVRRNPKRLMSPLKEQAQSFDAQQFFPHASNRYVGLLNPSAEPLADLLTPLDVHEYLGMQIDALTYKPAAEKLATFDELGRLQRPNDLAIPPGIAMGKLEFPGDDSVVLLAINGRVVSASPLIDFHGVSNSFALMLPPNQLRQENTIALFLLKNGEVERLNIQ